VAILVAVVACAACGAASALEPPALSPKAHLAAAVRSAWSSPSLTLRLDLSGDAAALGAIDPSLSSMYATAIADTSIVYEQERQPAPSKGADYDLSLEIGGLKQIELRVVGDTAYARLNVHSAIGFLAAPLIDRLEQMIPSWSGFEFAHAFLQGGWVSLDFGPLASALGLSGTSSATGSAASGSQAGAGATSDPANPLSALETALARAISVKRVGTSAGGTDNLLVSTSVERVESSLVGSLLGMLPARDRDAVQMLLGLINGGTASGQEQLHAFVQGTTLTAISFNALQLLPGHVAASGRDLPVTIDVSQAPLDVSAPAGATPVPSSLTLGLSALHELGLGNIGGFASSLASAVGSF
jgi:hypothetical protein